MNEIYLALELKSPQACTWVGPKGPLKYRQCCFLLKSYQELDRYKAQIIRKIDFKFDFAPTPRGQNSIFGILGGVMSDP